MEYSISPLKYFDSKLQTTLALFGTVVAISTTYIIIKWYKTKTYFKKLSIPCGPTPLPIFGNLLDVIKLGFADHDLNLVRKYGKIVGYFEGSTPNILLADTQFLRSMMIKDFNSFRNRRTYEGLRFFPFTRFLTVVKDDEWKNVRSIVTASFTSGKLKSMSKTMLPVSEVIMKHLDHIFEKDETIDAKELFGCYTLDIISTCAFGIQTDAINEPDSAFLKHLKVFFDNSLSSKIALLFLFPKLSGFLSNRGWIEFFSKKTMNFFRDFSEEMLERRRSKKEYREDLLQSMVDHGDTESQNLEVELTSTQNQNEDTTKNRVYWKPTSKTLTNADILAQEILFFTAGYDTTSTALSLVAYNLATHPECQNKLLKELDEALSKQSDVTYDMVQNMPYLDMVINETLRMYPPAFRFDRISNEDYQYGEMKIPKNTLLTVSIYAIHHDPIVYPEPEKFIPERFLPEERNKRDNMSFIPFGGGPRNCVGARFALLEMKIVLSKILSKYELIQCEKTPKKIEFQNNGLLKTKEPIILKLKLRF